jgi:hypothetical protein
MRVVGWGVSVDTPPILVWRIAVRRILLCTTAMPVRAAVGVQVQDLLPNPYAIRSLTGGRFVFA